MVKTSNGTGSSSGLLSRIESALVNSPVNISDKNLFSIVFHLDLR